MPSSLIRGRYVICKVVSRTEAEVIEDGAVFQRDGTIVEVGTYQELAKRYTADEVIGSDAFIVLPGLVNSHHHVGLTPVQLGSPDHPLELWFASRMAARDVDPYLDTLYSAFEMIESGVTTVQHLQGWVPGPIGRIQDAVRKVLKAYDDVGMRASFSYLVRDQNRLVYAPDEEFVKQLPRALGAEVAAYLEERSLPLENHFELFEELHGLYQTSERLRIQLAPANLHWCSDRALSMLKSYADKYEVPLHIHIVETAYQKEYAFHRGGMTAVQYLDRFGLLGPQMTLGHAIWLTDADIALAAERGCLICHNCSSNFRLRSGLAPLNAFERHGLHVGIGLDEAGINDDRDMLQEMRLVLLAHRVPGMDDDVPSCPQVLRMATQYGAETTPFGAAIGTLESGKAADMVVINWRDIAYPYLDRDVDPVAAVLHRARSSAVDTVLVAGEPILRGGRFTRLDKVEILDKLAQSLSVPLTTAEEQRRCLAKKVFPYVRRFYDGYLAKETHQPFYQLNSRK